MHSPETYIQLFFFEAANLSFFSNQTALCHLKQFFLHLDAQYLQCILMSYFFRIQMRPELQILRHPCKSPHPAKNFPVSFLSLPATYLSFAPIITIVFSVCFFLILKDSLTAQRQMRSPRSPLPRSRLSRNLHFELPSQFSGKSFLSFSEYFLQA